jgi:signal peptidase I
MYPSLEVGDLFLSSHVLDKPQRGQVIVFRYPPDPARSHVQRVVGLPGDTVEIRRGDLVLNGSLIDKRLLSDPCGTLQMECTIWQETIDGNSYKIAIVEEESLADPASRDFGPVTVPAGQLFVLGDNRDNSADSRYWGYLPIELVQANPRFIYWSSGDSGIRWNRIAKIVK